MRRYTDGMTISTPGSPPDPFLARAASTAARALSGEIGGAVTHDALGRDGLRCLAHLVALMDASPETLRSYAVGIHGLATVAREGGATDWQGVTRQHVVEWVKRMRVRGLGQRSIVCRMAAVNAMARFLGHMREADGAALWGRWRLDFRPPPMRLPRVLTQEEAAALCDAPWGPGATRDRLLLEILYGGGLRVGEASMVRLADYAPDRRWLSVHGKGGRTTRRALVTRHVPLGGYADRALGEYAYHVRGERRAALARRARREGNDSALREIYVLLNDHGRPLREDSARRIVARWGRAAGLGHVNPHCLRATYATHLIEGGANLRELQILLGHEHLNTTALYVNVSTDHLRRVVDACHPRAQLAAGRSPGARAFADAHGLT